MLLSALGKTVRKEFNIMEMSNRLDSLIGVARRVLESDFDPGLISEWRRQALECVSELFGDDHPYTYSLREKQDKTATRLDVLSEKGVLIAAKEMKASQMVRTQQSHLGKGH